MRFGAQDICLHQLHHTIAYERALQHWSDEVQPPVPGQPYHLVGSVQELWWTNELLITFAEGDIFVTLAPSGWTEITLPQSTKAMPLEPPKSHSCSSRAYPRGSLSEACSKSWPTATDMWATGEAEAPTTLPQEVMPFQSTSDHKPQCPLPGFAEIAQALWGMNPMDSVPLPVITGIQSKEAVDQYEVMGTAITVTWLLWHYSTGEVLINIQFCSKAFVGLELNPVAVDHLALTLQELSDLDDWTPHLTVWC